MKMKKSVLIIFMVSLLKPVFAQDNTIDISGNNTSSNYVSYDKLTCALVASVAISERQKVPVGPTGRTSRATYISILTGRTLLRRDSTGW